MNDNSRNFDRLITDEELVEIDKRFKKTEEEGLKNILKYFDRIHDKLFAFNNILIAGYFALSKLDNSMPVFNILIPICNLCFLVYMEFRMMEKSRFESCITNKPMSQINKYGKAIQNTNSYSLLTIATTSIVALVFLYHLLLPLHNR
jgi:hypothetical protein